MTKTKLAMTVKDLSGMRLDKRAYKKEWLSLCVLDEDGLAHALYDEMMNNSYNNMVVCFMDLVISYGIKRLIHRTDGASLRTLIAQSRTRNKQTKHISNNKHDRRRELLKSIL